MTQSKESIRKNPTPKYFKITLDKMLEFTKLTPKQQQLLLAMINKLKLTHEFDSFIGEATYKDFDYNTRQQYHKDKKQLVDLGFIFAERRKYFVRLDAVMYTSKRNYDHILRQVGAVKNPFGNFGGPSRIPPPPTK